MKKFVLYVTGLLMMSTAAVAQQITGVLKDQQGKPLEKATVSLLHQKDSSIVKLVTSKDNGNFNFSAVENGNYIVSATYVGYAPVYSAAFELNGGDVKVPDLILVKNTESLGAVTVTAKRPMVEVKADKTILNVEGTINATGTDALGLLRKSPGVMVDKDDNISLAGKNGVRIYIDGKPSPLSGTDLTSYLKSIQSAQIDAIELITNPSAKYDAAGNAGIINIKLKKNKTFGTNGSVNAGYNIGVYPKYNAGINLNHRNKSVNVFGSYNFSDNKLNTIFDMYRSIGDTVFNGHTDADFITRSHSFKTGADFYINKKSTFGVLVNGNFTENSFNNNSRTPISVKSTGVVDRILVAKNTNNKNANNATFNLNYRFADTAGHELSIDADYGMYRNKSNQLQPNYYYDASGNNLISSVFYRFISPTDINLFTVKVDYEQNLKGGRLGFGAKTSAINTDNNFNRYDVSQLHPEQKTLDIARSNQFDYKENINAAYVNYNKQLKGVMFQVGVRAENTISKGTSYSLNPDGSINTSNPQIFKRNYTDLFPSAALTFNKNPMNQWGLSYSRRIDRPAYSDLNPFEFKLDEYSYMKGNTNLRPQYTNIISLTNTYKYKLNTSLSYSRVNDVFTQIVDTAEKSKSFMTRKNLATQDVIAMNISYPFMYKSYMAFVNLSGNYSHYKADFGGGNRIVDLKAATFNIYMQHSYNFGKTKAWTGEVSGWYNSPSVWEGAFKSKAMWTVDAGLQKKIFKGNGTIKVSVSDIFFSMKFSGYTNFTGQYLRASGSFESRQFKTALTWRFGNSKVKASRQRADALENEKKRTQSSGGFGGQ
ncbi:MAG TPA: outer membrane beta-barrel family protein [Chitinophagaceae bacterium]|nr:outer membrane beta-barrel family protein [Chitinophagaceae bacterium]